MWPGARVSGVQGRHTGCRPPLSTSPGESCSANRRASSTWGWRSAEPEDAEPGWAEGAGHPGRRPSARGWGCRGARGGSGTPSPSARREAPAGSASSCYRTAFPLSINIDFPLPALVRLSEPSPTLPPRFPLRSPSAPPPPSPGRAGRRPGSPAVASLQRLALQCNSGTRDETVPLKADHQV